MHSEDEGDAEDAMDVDSEAPEPADDIAQYKLDEYDEEATPLCE